MSKKGSVIAALIVITVACLIFNLSGGSLGIVTAAGNFYLKNNNNIDWIMDSVYTALGFDYLIIRWDYADQYSSAYDVVLLTLIGK